MGYKGHYGEYTGNANHARTPITKRDVHSAIRDDKAHMDYLKRDVLHDAHHGDNKEWETADEKHITHLAEDVRYDEKKEGLSRESSKRAERKRKKAMRISERSGAERGDEYDYEDPRVQRLLQKARELDERSGEKKFSRDWKERKGTSNIY